ncbi:rhodanese-like domain-containing protein [uncultured Methylovirgula sp.]|uniref:rhodanese-like domain-containing protein n=1 Tax=uncultured Methylovirgula sp. TaxID=1285960 RepID=UPI00262609E7|nr:rhodanese-like domain-containing protein [uncultured Methylovirgula sp.]
MTARNRLQELTPAAVHEALEANRILLVDVREPNEYAAQRIPGAVLMPLSTFDPSVLPSPDVRDVVFHCKAGSRSAKAVEKCLARGVAHTTHLAGGIDAWKAARLPTIPPSSSFVSGLFGRR